MLLRSTLNPHSIRSTHQHLQTPSSYNYQVRIIKIIKVLGGRRFVQIQASQVIASVAAVLCRERKERFVRKSRKAEEESLREFWLARVLIFSSSVVEDITRSFGVSELAAGI